jgi:hypothetical protein
MDLANLLGLPPKAISLDGELGIAFGARGSGSAAAHYEPGRVVINLTRTRGAGSLAHELGHAFDDYFGKKLGGGKAGAYVSGRGFTKSDVPVLAAWANVMSAIKNRPKTKDEVTSEYQKEIDRTRENIRGWMSRMNAAAKGTAWEASVADATGILRYAPDEVKNEELKAALIGKTISRNNVEAVLRGIAKKLNQSRDDIKGAMSNASWLWSRMGWMEELKAGKKPVGTTHTDFYKTAEKLGDYWVRPHELLARAFENWVARTLTAKNQQSDYLVAYAKGDEGTPWSAIYPKGAEAEAIGTQMVGLVSAIRDFVMQKTVEKSMGRRAFKALRKAVRGAMKPGHKYVRREPQAEGYKYVYQEPPKVSVPGTPVSDVASGETYKVSVDKEAKGQDTLGMKNTNQKATAANERPCPTCGTLQRWQPGPDDGGDVVGRTPAGWYCDNCDRPKPTQKTPAERIAKLERLISYQKRELWLAEQEGRVPPGPGVFRARYEDTISRLSGQLSAAKAGA